MTSKKTVLVLGAGASKAYGFPTASVMKDEVAADCMSATKGHLSTVLVNLDFEMQEIANFGHSLRASGMDSIDAYLATAGGKKFVEIGKLAIAYWLLSCERKKNILNPPEDGAWYDRFIQSYGRSESEYSSSKYQLAFITFNYDRSLEHRLRLSMHANTNMNDEKIEHYILNLPIIHMYGSLGHYPFPSTVNPIEFELENKLNPANQPYDEFLKAIRLASESIRLVDDKGEKAETIKSYAREEVEKAKKIVFLGFGYSEENLSNVLGDVDLFGKQVMGTAVGLMPGERDRVRNLFNMKYNKTTIELDQNQYLCDDYIREYSVFE